MTGLAEEVRDQIRLALRITGISQAELGRRLGISPKHISQMMTGRVAVSLDMAERMLTEIGWELEVDAVPIRRFKRRSLAAADEVPTPVAAGLLVQCTAHGDPPVAMVHEGTLWRCPQWMPDESYAGHARWVSDADVAAVPAGSSKRFSGTVVISVPAQP